MKNPNGEEKSGRKIPVNFHDSTDDSEAEEGSPVMKTLKEYGGATTVHGIPYILEKGRTPAERCLWVVLVITAFLVALKISIQIYNDWRDELVVTSVSTTGYNIEDIEHPSFTICAQGSVKEITGNFK